MKYYILFNHKLMTANVDTLQKAKEIADDWARTEKWPKTGLFITDGGDRALVMRTTRENLYHPHNPEPGRDIITYPMSGWYLREWEGGAR